MTHFSVKSCDKLISSSKVAQARRQTRNLKASDYFPLTNAVPRLLRPLQVFLCRRNVASTKSLGKRRKQQIEFPKEKCFFVCLKSKLWCCNKIVSLPEMCKLERRKKIFGNFFPLMLQSFLTLACERLCTKLTAAAILQDKLF